MKVLLVGGGGQRGRDCVEIGAVEETEQAVYSAGESGDGEVGGERGDKGGGRGGDSQIRQREEGGACDSRA